jgi:hypothetical protein
MQSTGLARFAKELLTKPCCCRGSIPVPLEGLQYIWAQRCFSTADTPSTATANSASADTTADPQQTQSSPRDTARLTYEADMRKLRRKWQIQQAEKLATRAKAEAIKDANKAVTMEAHRRKVAEMKELRMQIHEEKRRLQIAELVGFSIPCCCCYCWTVY